jgi:monofunctional biosynthetic peptidoglycan transglycosylase
MFLALVILRSLGPPVSPVAIAEGLSGKTLTRNWVPLVKISPSLSLAVIASEDGRFCDHWGVDWREAWHAVRGGGQVGAGPRGASTIAMQLVKNLYLWPERSYLRKLLEVPLAYLLTALWPKRVLMETYLNITPLGPGVTGAEAASQRFFGKSAADLTRREAILLAMALPSPGLRNPAKPTQRMLRRLPLIERNMKLLGPRADCVLP